MLNSKTISAYLNTDAQKAYAFISNLENLPKWAKTFCKSIEKISGNWIMQTDQGPLQIRLADKNEFGVLDHYLKPASGNEVFVPMRVVPNGSGCEIIFTVFQQPGMSKENFYKDIELVNQDLENLKAALKGLSFKL